MRFTIAGNDLRHAKEMIITKKFYEIFRKMAWKKNTYICEFTENCSTL